MAVQNFLVENNKWNEALKFNFPKEYAAIEAKRVESADEDDADYDLIDKVYKEELIALTSKALSCQI